MNRNKDVLKRLSDNEFAWQQALTPGQLRAVAFLHESNRRASYTKAFRAVQQAEGYRAAGNIGYAALLLMRAGYAPLDARTAVYAMGTPGHTQEDWEIDPDWAKMSAQARAKEWQRWWDNNRSGRWRS